MPKYERLYRQFVRAWVRYLARKGAVKLKGVDFLPNNHHCVGQENEGFIYLKLAHHNGGAILYPRLMTTIVHELAHVGIDEPKHHGPLWRARYQELKKKLRMI
jgi:hypothetical protein